MTDSSTPYSVPPAFGRLVGSGVGMRFRARLAVRLMRTGPAGVLPAPGAAFVTDDGRALAWFGDGRPCVVHPTLDELCRMHGVTTDVTRAA